MPTTTAVSPDTGSIKVNVFDGSRQPMSKGVNLLVRVRDGNQNELPSRFVDGASLQWDGLQVFDNFGDDYTVVVSADGFKQAGFTPVHISRGAVETVNLMLLPNNAQFNFHDALWPALRQTHPWLIPLLSHGAGGDGAAQDRYTQLMETRPGSLASFLNLTTAMAQIVLPAEGSPLEYFKELVWDDSFAQDRFFAYADRVLVDQVKLAAQQNKFAPELDPQILHPTATSSFKQIQFGEANVQLTFHEGDARQIDGVDCVKVEPDIDYFKDLAAHFLLEVIVNAVTGTLTDPKTVYQLRWIAGQRIQVDFDPPYTIAA